MNKSIVTLLVAALITTSIPLPVFAGETTIESSETELVSNTDAPVEETVSDDTVSLEGFHYDFKNGELTFTFPEDYDEYAKYIANMPDILIIPVSINGMAVTKVVFPYNDSFTQSIKTLEFPDSVTEIGCEYYNSPSFDNLENLRLPAGLKSGVSLFAINKIKKLYVPKEIPPEMWPWINSIKFRDMHPDFYYTGTIKDYRNSITPWLKDRITPNELWLNTNIHFNSVYRDYKENIKAGATDDINMSYNRKIIEKDGIAISYDSEIPYYGKKAKPEYFNITISYNGTEYSASKIKVSIDKKHNGKFSITDISPADKKLKKAVKKMTKGKNALSFISVPYIVTHRDEILTTWTEAQDYIRNLDKYPNKSFKIKMRLNEKIVKVFNEDGGGFYSSGYDRHTKEFRFESDKLYFLYYGDITKTNYLGVVIFD